MKLENIKIYVALPATSKIIVQFLIKLLLLFSAWFIIYNLLLGPSLLIDKPLTDFITNAVVKIINIFSPYQTVVSWAESDTTYGNYITKDGLRIMNVGHKCNGIDLIFTYISIIILLPYSSPFKRKFFFCIGGVILLTVANIIRVCLLYFMAVYQKSAFDFSHHYLFTILMYVLIFYCWLLFIKDKKLE